jgi:GNAT superfamily N-acetyltransferase
VTTSTAISFRPASSFTLEAYTDIFTRSFAGYFYSMAQTVQGFAARVRTEHIDLHRSVVLMTGDAPAGEATMAIRGNRAWCGGFGILPEFRGQGLAPMLFAEFLSQARQAGTARLTLEVLTKNAPALKVYTSAGLQIQRETRLFEWLHPSPADAVIADWPKADVALVTENFRRLHPVAPVWGRNLPGVILRAGLRQGVVEFDGRVMGYVLFTPSEGAARIIDLAAVDTQTTAVLLRQLQAAFTRITSIDEPADSPLTSAFDLCGFREFDRQYELAIDFAPA